MAGNAQQARGSDFSGTPMLRPTKELATAAPLHANMRAMLTRQHLSRRQLRPLVGGLLLSLMANHGAFAQATVPARVLASSSSESIKPQQLTAAMPAGGAPLTLGIEVHGEAENRLVFTSLRSTAKLAAISLFDPRDALVWRRTPAELGITTQADARQPDLGDAIVMPAVRNAAPGRWRLQLEPAPGAKGQASVSYRVLPRFELNLSLLNAGELGKPIAAGEPVLLVLRGQEYGAPLTSWEAVPLSLRDSQGVVLANPIAQAGARTATGIMISDEPGALIARASLPAVGEYRINAQHQFQSKGKPLQVELRLHATAPKASLALSGLRLERQAGVAGACARAVLFEFEVNVAAAGSYACNISLVGPTGARMASASNTLEVGSGRITVRVGADKLSALGGPLKELAGVSLLRFGSNETGQVAELPRAPLSGEQQEALRALCTP